MFEIFESFFNDYCNALVSISDSNKWELGYLQGYLLGYEQASEDISQTEIKREGEGEQDPAELFF